jgi:hypothetical protein
MICAFNPIPNAHQMRKRSARLLIGAYREKGKRAKRAFAYFPKARQSRNSRQNTLTGSNVMDRCHQLAVAELRHHVNGTMARRDGDHRDDPTFRNRCKRFEESAA